MKKCVMNPNAFELNIWPQQVCGKYDLKGDDIQGILFANNYEYMSVTGVRVKDQDRNFQHFTVGKLWTVGKFYNNPVCVSIRPLVAYNHILLVLEDTSIVVNHDMIAEWISVQFPNILGKEDAGNAHNLFHKFSIGSAA